MADNRGTYHLTDNPDIYEPARNNNFEFQIPFFADDGLLKAGVDSGITPQDDDYIKNAQEVIRVAVESSSVPQFKLGVLDVNRGNNTAHFAGRPTFETTSLVVKDYISKNSGYSNPKDVMMAWRALAYDVRTEKIHRASNYKFTCTLRELTPEQEVIREWVIEGAWCSEVNEDNFTSENDGQRKFTAVIVYDKAYPVKN